MDNKHVANELMKLAKELTAFGEGIIMQWYVDDMEAAEEIVDVLKRIVNKPGSYPEELAAGYDHQDNMRAIVLWSADDFIPDSEMLREIDKKIGSIYGITGQSFYAAGDYTDSIRKFDDMLEELAG